MSFAGGTNPLGKIELHRPNRLAKSIVFADGVGSSGKGMLSHLLSSLNGVEKQSNHYAIDYVSTLHWLGKISEDAAVTYLQTEVDYQLYHIMMSRDVNFRPKDSTGVLQNAFKFEYIRRLFMPEGESVLKRIDEKNPVLNEAPHDALRSAPLFFRAFGDDLKIIFILRDPFELILDWNRRGFGTRIGLDRREFQFSANIKGQSYPLFAADSGFLDKFDSLHPLERVVLFIDFCLRQNLNGYNALTTDRRAQVKIIEFDSLAERPWEVLKSISNFLGRDVTGKSQRAIKRENLPRKPTVKKDLFDSIKTQIRVDLHPMLAQLNEVYMEFQALTEVDK